MYFTEFGKKEAQSEPLFKTEKTGASAHVEACGYDTGKTVVLTGKNVNGKRLRAEAKSIYGAWFKMQAAWGFQNAWLEDGNGKRKLIISR